MTDRVQDEQVLGPEHLGAGVTSPHHSQSTQSGEIRTRAVSLPEGVAQPFGASLEPALLHTCGGRLSRIGWFRADWQRGGALTGYASYTDEDDRRHDVVVKLPVPPGERRWLDDLQQADHVVPRLYAHGEQLNGYDIAWVVMQRMPHGPLGPMWEGSEFDLLVDAAGRFYAAAAQVPLRGKPIRRDWDELFEKARTHVHQHSVPDEQRWKHALKKAHRRLREWIAAWNDRPDTDWCHGDLHLGNALTHHEPPKGPAVLIDFARTHPGCWVEDAVYFEHLFWSHRDRLAGRKLCKAMAKARREHDLTVDAHWADFAASLRALYAMSTPARLYDDGSPGHLAAALDVLEQAVRT
jgi:Ser/Thr protein kinase RdoA (MazF antagonist)